MFSKVASFDLLVDLVKSPIYLARLRSIGYYHINLSSCYLSCLNLYLNITFYYIGWCILLLVNHSVFSKSCFAINRSVGQYSLIYCLLSTLHRLNLFDGNARLDFISLWIYLLEKRSLFTHYALIGSMDGLCFHIL